MKRKKLANRIMTMVLAAALMTAAFPASDIKADTWVDNEADTEADICTESSDAVSSETEISATEIPDAENPDTVILETDTGDTEEKCGDLVDDDPLLERYEKQKSYSQDELTPFAETEDLSDETLESMSDYPVSGYDHGKYATGYDIKRGIDVSKYQGSINWSEVKKDGVEFAFIRVGFRGYGSSGSLNEDTKYKTNISEALKAGIPVGVYMFSQAITVDEAKAEADYILSRIGSYNITLPVVMDYEYTGGSSGRLTKANLSKSAATEICNAFCEKVEAAGYDAMVYADYNMLTNHLNASQIYNKYKVWIARWNNRTGFSGNYSVWQFTDSGSVNGISGAVDLDFGYDISSLPVTLHGNGGYFETGEDLSLKVSYGSSVKSAMEDNSISNPQKTGTTFLGWSTASDASKADYNTENAVTAGNLELYAVWSGDYTRKAAAPYIYLYDSESSKKELFETATVNYVDPGTQAACSSGLNNETIYYSMGDSAGSTPDPTPETGTKYTSPLKITEKTVIKLLGVKEGYGNSDITVYTFDVNDVSEDIGSVAEEDLPGDESMTRAERIALIPDGFWMSEIENVTYDGKAHKPEPRVYFGKYLLKNKENYTLSYSNNTKAGTGTVNVNGKGGYSGTCSQDFTIEKRDISDEINAIADISVKYNGKNQNPSISITADGRKLSGSDYYIDSIIKKADSQSEYDTPCVVCKDPGTYIYTVAAKDGSNYKGSGQVKFTIISNERILISSLSVDKIPDQLIADYYLSENLNSEGYYEVRPSVTIRNSSRQIIDQSNFDISYKNNTAVGTATVTILPKDDDCNYVGSKSVTFKITGYPINKISITGTNPATGKNEDISRFLSVTYNTKAQKPFGEENLNDDAPSDYVLKYIPSKNADPIILEKGVDYRVSYTNNVKVGNASVIFTGIGRFTGTIKKTFKINEYNPETVSELSSHIFIEFVNPDSYDNESGKYIAQYEYAKGGVAPKVNVYYEPAACVTESTSAATEDAVLLTPKTDYSISYSNYKNAAEYDEKNSKGSSIAPAVVITGNKSFKGKVTAVYTILKKNIGSMDMSVGDRVASNKANQYSVTPVLTDPGTENNAKLAAGTDYDKKYIYTYAEDVTVRRIDSKTKKTGYYMKNAGDEVSASDIIPAGTSIKITVNGVNNYTGSISGVYSVASIDISNATVKIADRRYKGVPVTPDKSDITSISIRIKGSTVSIDPSEYEIVPGSFKNNNGAGTGSLMIHGLGQFCGYKTVSYKITAKNMYYQVSFFANGGTGTMKTQNISKKGTALTKNNYKLKGYEFNGWNTAADGSGVSYTDKEIIQNVFHGSTLELYAQWKQE